MAAKPGKTARKTIGDVRWEIVAEFEEGLDPLLKEMGKPVGGHGLKIRRDDPEGAAIFTVKTNRPGLAGELFVKVFRRQSAPSIFPDAKVGAQWKMAFEHARRGLPVAGHLALGAKRRGPFIVEEYLIQESLTSFEPFEEFFRATFRPELPGVKPQDKRRVIRDLAGLIRGMHDRGISRPDIEPANIMAAPRSGGGVRFVFVDLDRARLKHSRRGFNIDERIVELSRFYSSFSPLLSQGYRIRFFREYFAGDGLGAGEFKDLVKRIADSSTRLAKKQEKNVLRAIAKRQDPYFWFAASDHRIYLRKPAYQNAVIELLDKMDESENQSQVRLKQVGGLPPKECVLIRCDQDGGEEDRTIAPPAGDARWAFIAGALMDHHGIGHYRVVAAVEPRRDRRGYYLASRPGKGELYLSEYLARKVSEEFSGVSWDRKFMIRVARFLLNLHDLGFWFPRPSGEDFWVRFTDEGTHQLRLFNLHRIERAERAREEDLLYNLFKLWTALPISQADGQLFAEEYLRFSRRHIENRKRWQRKFLEWQMNYSGPASDSLGRAD